MYFTHVHSNKVHKTFKINTENRHFYVDTNLSGSLPGQSGVLIWYKNTVLHRLSLPPSSEIEVIKTGIVCMQKSFFSANQRTWKTFYLITLHKRCSECVSFTQIMV